MAKELKKNLRDFWLLRADPILKQKMDYVIEERIKRGTSKMEDIKNNKLTYQRLSLAIARHEKLINDLINANLI